MAKANGLIGNFKGKLGNTVGYSLKDSNNKQTQGVRVYQPVVRNPKTAAQAEQRAKLAPINATYRELKTIIDRGQEGKAYGNKSRLAWLSAAMKAFNGGWFEKNATITMPALVPLTKGSLSINIPVDTSEDCIILKELSVSSAETNTIGKLSIALLAKYQGLQEGDQLTAVLVKGGDTGLNVLVESIVIDSTSTVAIPSWILISDGEVDIFSTPGNGAACAVIISREGDNGAHLRTNTSLIKLFPYEEKPLTPAAKQAAIESYMSQGANTDWAEESLK